MRLKGGANHRLKQAIELQQQYVMLAKILNILMELKVIRQTRNILSKSTVLVFLGVTLLEASCTADGMSPAVKRPLEPSVGEARSNQTLTLRSVRLEGWKTSKTDGQVPTAEKKKRKTKCVASGSKRKSAGGQEDVTTRSMKITTRSFSKMIPPSIQMLH